MERIKKTYKSMPLKKALEVTITFSIILSVLLSGFVLIVTRSSYYMLSNSNPQSIAVKIHDTVTFLLIIICVIFPFIMGIHFFYKNKLEKPLQILMDGTEQIIHDNLDFELNYDSEDELGSLCSSFDKMRKELQSNHKQMWHMVQQRKELNAAFAHDLRTPLTVLRGYTDFLEEYIPSAEKSDEKLLSTNRTMAQYVGRLEDYVDTMNRIQKLEDTPMKAAPISTVEFVRMAMDNIQLVAKEYGKQFSVQNDLIIEVIKVDVPLIFRAMENATRNAFQYAKSKVFICMFLENKKLCIEVIDDGIGFHEKDLEQALRPFYSSSKSDAHHYGMGLAICKILCENHGGNILIENTKNSGAKVQLSFLLQK